MTATAAPFGLSPVRHITGGIVPPPRAIPDGVASAYGSNIPFGAPVILATNGTLTIATTAADIIGVFAGIQYVVNATSLLTIQPNWVASTTYLAGTCTAYVYDDPGIIYQMQSNGSLAAAAVGDQADFVNPGSQNSTTGYSVAALSSSLAGAGVQAQMRIVGLVPRIDNAWGDSFTIVETMIARHQYVANKLAV